MSTQQDVQVPADAGPGGAERVLRLVLVAGPLGDVNRVRSLLATRGLPVLGGRGTTGEDRHLYVAGTPEQWADLDARMRRREYPAVFIRQIRPAELGDVLVEPSPGRPLVEGSWAATLHADLMLSEPYAPVPAGTSTLTAFAAAVERVGGRCGRPYPSGSLTYIGVAAVPDVDAARELASFPGLRTLAPMAVVGLR